MVAATKTTAAAAATTTTTSTVRPRLLLFKLPILRILADQKAFPPDDNNTMTMTSDFKAEHLIQLPHPSLLLDRSGMCQELP